MTLRRGLAATLIVTMSSATSVGEPRARTSREALELFERSTASYRAGRFSEAVELLRRAYRIDADPVILYNLAKALEADGALEGALEAYERYLSGASPPDRPVVERRIATLREQMAVKARLRAQEEAATRERVAREEAARHAREQAEAERAATARAAADQRRVLFHRSTVRGAVAWSLAGVGTAGIGAAIGLGVAAGRARDRADATPGAADAEREFMGAQNLALGSNIALGVGGALALIGIVWGSVESAKQQRLRR